MIDSGKVNRSHYLCASDTAPLHCMARRAAVTQVNVIFVTRKIICVPHLLLLHFHRAKEVFKPFLTYYVYVYGEMTFKSLQAKFNPPPPIKKFYEFFW
jgi:hypothetical protein